MFRVTDIVVPAFDASSQDAKRIDEALRRSLSDEIVGQYVSQLESELGASINEAAVRQALGSGTTN